MLSKAICFDVLPGIIVFPQVTLLGQMVPKWLLQGQGGRSVKVFLKRPRILEMWIFRFTQGREYACDQQNQQDPQAAQVNLVLRTQETYVSKIKVPHFCNLVPSNNMLRYRNDLRTLSALTMVKNNQYAVILPRLVMPQTGPIRRILSRG